MKRNKDISYNIKSRHQQKMSRIKNARDSTETVHLINVILVLTLHIFVIQEEV